jgi:hypothetical protein
MSSKKAFYACQILFRKGKKLYYYSLDALKGILFLEKCFFRKKINMDSYVTEPLRCIFVIFEGFLLFCVKKGVIEAAAFCLIGLR